MVVAERQGANTAPANGHYLPEYTKGGDLVLPKNWRSWVYVGSPLTPDALNNGQAGFPEYPNVYIDRHGMVTDVVETEAPIARR